MGGNSMSINLKRVFSFFLVSLIFISYVYINPTKAFSDTEPEVSIVVSQDDLLDIVLTLGQTDSDVSTLGEDLTSALVMLGVPEEKISIQALEATNVSAGNVSEGWKTYDHITTSWTFTDFDYNPVPVPKGAMELHISTYGYMMRDKGSCFMDMVLLHTRILCLWQTMIQHQRNFHSQ